MFAIPSLCWVKKGAAKLRPDRVRLPDAELQKLFSNSVAEGELSEDDSEEHETDDSGKSKKRKSLKTATPEYEDKSDEESDFVKRYDFDDYEDLTNTGKRENADSDEWSDVGSDEEHKERSGLMKLSSATNFLDPKDDPYIQSDLSDEDSDLELTAEDNMIAVGKVAGDLFELRAYVFNENDDNLYVHHDTLLPSFPLCLEWMDFDPGESSPGNMVAMGSMDPDIHIWDLDVVDTLEPAFTLHGNSSKKNKKKKVKASGHTDAVLDLAWNQHIRKVLASASADFTVGLWDLEEGLMVTQIKSHAEKVQTLQWHPVEQQSLLSGSFDGTVKVYDCRSPDKAQRSWDLKEEVERVLWNTHNPFNFLCSTDVGHVICYDVRKDKAVFSMNTHQSATTGLAQCPQTPGCLVTGSSDKTLKVWDIRNPNECRKVWSKNLSLGQLHCVAANPDSSLVFVVGGERDIKVVNLKKQAEVCTAFDLKCLKPNKTEYSLEVQADDSSMSEDEHSKSKKRTKKNKKKKKKRKDI